jgi:hypothetical protein
VLPEQRLGNGRSQDVAIVAIFQLLAAETL